MTDHTARQQAAINVIAKDLLPCAKLNVELSAANSVHSRPTFVTKEDYVLIRVLVYYYVSAHRRGHSAAQCKVM